MHRHSQKDCLIHGFCIWWLLPFAFVAESCGILLLCISLCAFAYLCEQKNKERGLISYNYAARNGHVACVEEIIIILLLSYHYIIIIIIVIIFRSMLVWEVGTKISFYAGRIYWWNVMHRHSEKDWFCDYCVYFLILFINGLLFLKKKNRMGLQHCNVQLRMAMKTVSGCCWSTTATWTTPTRYQLFVCACVCTWWGGVSG